jgi:hypothetical protein
VRTTFVRILCLPLAFAAIAALVAVSPAKAGGGDPPGPPPFNLVPVSVGVDLDRQAVVTYELTCNDEATGEGAHVDIFAGVSQKFGNSVIGEGVSTLATCAPGTQTIQLVVSEASRGFHPGWVELFTELQGCTSTTCFQAAGTGEFKAHPVR